MLAEDAVFLREPLLRVLADSGIDVVAQCDSAREVLAHVRTYQPDVAIVDLREDRTPAALDVARTVRRDHPATGVVVLAEHVAVDGARHLLEVASTGVGYLLKDRLADVEHFVGQVRAVATDGTAIDAEVISEVATLGRNDDPLDALTAREGDVLRLLADGLSNDAIAEQLVVTKRAVERHQQHLPQAGPAAYDRRRAAGAGRSGVPPAGSRNMPAGGGGAARTAPRRCGRTASIRHAEVRRTALLPGVRAPLSTCRDATRIGGRTGGRSCGFGMREISVQDQVGPGLGREG